MASRCGFTKQYKGLQALHEQYAPKGLIIAGFPANNFGKQEPGTNAEIQTFCTERFKVTFPMFAKVSVKGEDKAPLFSYLTGAANPDFTGDIKWNFEKILIDGKGNVVRRYRSRTKPSDAALTEAIDALLPKK